MKASFSFHFIISFLIIYLSVLKYVPLNNLLDKNIELFLGKEDINKKNNKENKRQTGIKMPENSLYFLSEQEIYILASIVQNESNIFSEQKKIASVYLNRLKKNMLLQADPTVQYCLIDLGLSKSYRRLYNKDYKINHKYNTYKYKGLPPSPIDKPTKTALKAVLEHEKNDYLYFCSKGDGTNTHNFSITYEEHLKNVELYKETRNKLNNLSSL